MRNKEDKVGCVKYLSTIRWGWWWFVLSKLLLDTSKRIKLSFQKENREWYTVQTIPFYRV